MVGYTAPAPTALASTSNLKRRRSLDQQVSGRYTGDILRSQMHVGIQGSTYIRPWD